MYYAVPCTPQGSYEEFKTFGNITYTNLANFALNGWPAVFSFFCKL